MPNTFATYQEFLQYIEDPVPDYYETLLVNHQLVLDRTAVTNQGVVAREIGITGPQASLALKLLRAYRELEIQSKLGTLDGQ